MLAPVARFCVRNGFKIKEFTELLKKALIDAAVSELKASREQISVSKIHVMSGVPRVEVKRIYVKGERKSSEVNLLSRVLARWQQDKRFLTKSGKPRVLTLEGMSSEFVKLVTSVSISLNPYTVLFELERMGLVEKTTHGVKLKGRSYVTSDHGEGFQFLAEDVADLIETVQENLDGKNATPNHHIKTEFNNIPAEYLQRIREWFDKEGASFHQRARNFLSKLDRDSNTKVKTKNNKTIRAAIGSFSRTEEVDS
ncbi:MAG: hypothetical protein KDD70_10300 [Bdellovibrionales bacterium]|nr:hypothetical protein [Bdellovibrionales bacterium]